MTPEILAAATALATLALVGVEYASSRRPAGTRSLGVWLTKPLASTGFVLAAWTAGAAEHDYGRIVLISLGLCWLGDVLLIPKSKRSFLAGLVSFLLGHVGYVVAFAVSGVQASGALVAAAAVTLAGLPIARWLLPKVESKMKGPVVAYMLVISVMVATASGAAANDGRWLIPMAAVLFYISDICVARERFVESSFVNRALGLPLYYGAQIIFALSTGVF